MFKILDCPACGSEKIKKVKRNWKGKYKNQTYSVPSLEFYECLNCCEKVYDREAMQKIENYSPAFNKISEGNSVR